MSTTITRCNQCGREWPEDRVPKIRIEMGTVGEEVIDGCDNCGTDAYLMDVTEKESNVPNLDAMDADELMAFWMKHQGGRGYTELLNYASNKATAIGCRSRGEIGWALMYEGICDDIYKRLPDWARW